MCLQQSGHFLKDGDRPWRELDQMGHSGHLRMGRTSDSSSKDPSSSQNTSLGDTGSLQWQNRECWTWPWSSQDTPCGSFCEPLCQLYGQQGAYWELRSTCMGNKQRGNSPPHSLRSVQVWLWKDLLYLATHDLTSFRCECTHGFRVFVSCPVHNERTVNIKGELKEVSENTWTRFLSGDDSPLPKGLRKTRNLDSPVGSNSQNNWTWGRFHDLAHVLIVVCSKTTSGIDDAKDQ